MNTRSITKEKIPVCATSAFSSPWVVAFLGADYLNLAVANLDPTILDLFARLIESSPAILSATGGLLIGIAAVMRACKRTHTDSKNNDEDKN